MKAACTILSLLWFSSDTTGCVPNLSIPVKRYVVSLSTDKPWSDAYESCKELKTKAIAIVASNVINKFIQMGREGTAAGGVKGDPQFSAGVKQFRSYRHELTCLSDYLTFEHNFSKTFYDTVTIDLLITGHFDQPIMELFVREFVKKPFEYEDLLQPRKINLVNLGQDFKVTSAAPEEMECVDVVSKASPL